ncbi:cobalamin-dependent protein [Anaerocolumna sedimenticola]|uniref:cobalamin-dependent protein n=1 Tax=Anaerocolumna sedimenticola TaxID=2696063 RepID=UPI002ED093FB
MTIIEEISTALQKGKAKQVKVLVQQLLDEGENPKKILNEGLLAGMSCIGEKFKNNEVFVPEVLVAARAMNAGLSLLEPILAEIGNQPLGKAVIGTVKGDLHDIGKNLVSMMLKGAGFQIIDLGIDVDAEVFVNKAEEEDADIICMSALLTTTMSNMKDIIDILIKKVSGINTLLWLAVHRLMIIMQNKSEQIFILRMQPLQRRLLKKRLLCEVRYKLNFKNK